MNFLSYKDFILFESKNFKNTYILPIDWWSVWKKENSDKYEIIVNAIDKTYEISDSKSKELIFIYDYNRQRIFTNKNPQFFEIEDENITPAELTKVADKEKEKIEPAPEEEKDDKKKKEDDPMAAAAATTEEE